MKKILYLLTFIGAVSLISCSSELETNPTDKISGQIMLNNPDGGQAVLNGMYRALYVSDWGPGWEGENSGIMAYVQAADLMGEDHIMLAAGQGWFWYDYRLQVASDYSDDRGRPYQTWNIFYTLISNANTVIAQENVWTKTAKSQAVLGQAYAMRAFAYSYLIQFYQQSIAEGTDQAGVPIYTKPTTLETEGAPRGKITDVYTLINTDIDKAVEYLEEAQKNGWTREHESNIDYYVANGIKARIALNEGIDYNRALTAAKEAMKKTGLTVLPVADFLGWNKKTSANAMWALEVIATQSEGFPGFFSHMDADAPGMYASRARRIISTGLYNLIPSTDERKIQWWRAPMSSDKEQTGNSMVSYCQLKFRYANVTTRIGDYLIMRVEEMILIAAEAEARLDNYTEARRYLQLLGDKRDPKYADRLAGLVNGKTYGSNTLDAPTNVLEEVLLQRRIELWGEYPRGFDLKRLRLGYNRTYTGSNHTYKIQVAVADKRLTLPIPQAEFDGNVNMDQIKDQNPM